MKRVFCVILVCFGILKNNVAIASGKHISPEEKRAMVVRRIIDRKESEYKNSLKKIEDQANFNLIGLHATLAFTAASWTMAACFQDYSKSCVSNMVTGVGVALGMVLARNYNKELSRLEIQENSLKSQQQHLHDYHEILKSCHQSAPKVDDVA